MPMDRLPVRSPRPDLGPSSSPGRRRHWLPTTLALVLGCVIAAPVASQCPSQWLPGQGFELMRDVSHLTVLGNGDLLADLHRWDGTAWTFVNPPTVLPGLHRFPSPLATQDLGNGTVLIAGSQVNTVSVMAWDGTNWSTVGQPFHRTAWPNWVAVNALAVFPNGDLVAGGEFDDFGSGYGGIARLSGGSWVPMGAGLGIVQALVMFQGELLAGGSFPAGLVAGTTGAQGIARWNGSGWVSVGTGLTTPGFEGVRALAILPSGDLVAAGATISSLGNANVARWNGTTWSPMGTLTSTFGPARVRVLQVTSAGDLIAGGEFDDIDGVPNTRSIARWNGTAWSAMGAGIGVGTQFAQVNTITSLPGGPVVVGGSFENAGGVMGTYGLARWGCAAGIADFTSYGTGCYDRALSSFYELFWQQSTPFDLAHSTLHMVPTGTGYTVTYVPGSPALVNPTSPDLGLGDDAVSVPIPLPFSIPYPSGSTNQIVVGSNGYLYLQPETNGDPSASYVQLCQLAPRHAPLWYDYDPAAGNGTGTIHVDIDAVAQRVRVTWLGVQEWGSPGVTSTFQVEMSSSGEVDYRYLGCSLTYDPLVGFSPGNGARVPYPIDVTAASPFTTLGPDITPPVLAPDNRPILGSTVTLQTTDIPANCPFGATVIGWTRHDPGIDLTNLGMPGCLQFASTESIAGFIPQSGTGTTTLTIPIDPGFLGVPLRSQSLALSPGVNALGVLTSNGIELLLGHM